MTDAERVRRLEKALAYVGNTHMIEDVVAEIKAGTATLWQRGDSIAVTQIMRYPRKTVGNIWLFAGRLMDAAALAPEMEEWARQHDATRMEVTGRPGWLQTGLPLGYKPAGMCFAKDLRHG